ncbi:MAG: peptide-methionine (S)-S-oxide reductase MsrA [Candidatus Methylacidiphilales bacterium]
MPQSEQATLGGGCFWCLEAFYLRLPGVQRVVSGYAGGHDPAPTYESVCSGSTGHAEVIQIDFDPSISTFNSLLSWFWKMHDPTTLNRQGHDVGTQYRSIILTHSSEQDSSARQSLQNAQPSFDQPIVTEIKPLNIFYPAESHHQNYFNRHPYAPYCQVVISPKLGRLGLE